MGLLQPEPGLLIWMTLAFAVVFILLAKFGFVRCGEIHYAGDPRIAFQKIL